MTLVHLNRVYCVPSANMHNLQILQTKKYTINSVLYELHEQPGSYE